MKKALWIVVLVAAIVAVRPMEAAAINREWSAALGFLGGLLVANASCQPQRTVYQETVVVEQPVICEPVIIEEPAGHYEYREQQVWIPGRWVYMGHGRCQRRLWEPGYYRTETIRVWVPAPRRYYSRRYR